MRKTNFIQAQFCVVRAYWPKDGVSGCVSRGLNHATFGHLFCQQSNFISILCGGVNEWKGVKFTYAMSFPCGTLTTCMINFAAAEAERIFVCFWLSDLKSSSVLSLRYSFWRWSFPFSRFHVSKTTTTNFPMIGNFLSISSYEVVAASGSFEYPTKE